MTTQEIDKALVDLFNDIQFPQEPKGLYDPLRYMISIGGKRIRPRLCLLAYSLYGGELSEEILNPAAALEVFHTFTLIHDDIMDKSPLRRGMQTVWKKWNEDTAILSGDVMSIDSYKRLAKAPVTSLPAVLELFSTTAAQVCEGQQLDMDFESEREVSMEQYMEMIGLKTAVLIACSAKMGGIIAGASSEDCELLYEYGYMLGLAFQVADDYLDTYGDEKVFGKPIGGDIVNNKKSWLLTRATATTADKERLFRKMDMPASTPEQKDYKINVIKEIYAAVNIEEEAKAEIKRLSGLAMDAAMKLSIPEEAKAVLREFAEKLVGRVN